MAMLDTKDLIKIAQLLGTTRALLDAGYSEKNVKLAFMQTDIFSEYVAETFTKEASGISSEDLMVKEALWGAVANIGSKILPWLTRTGSKLVGSAKTIGSATGKAQRRLMQGGKIPRLAGKVVGGAGHIAGKTTKGLGKKTFQATQALRQAGRGMQTAPFKTLGKGMLNFGKGAVIGGGKGIGGTLGKGTLYGGLAYTGASMLGGSSGGRQIPQNMRNLPQISPTTAQQYGSAGRSFYGG